MWVYGNRDVDLMMKQDAEGEVIGSVIRVKSQTFCALDADCVVIGYGKTEAEGKAIVDAFIAKHGAKR